MLLLLLGYRLHVLELLLLTLLLQVLPLWRRHMRQTLRPLLLHLLSLW